MKDTPILLALMLFVSVISATPAWSFKCDDEVAEKTGLADHYKWMAKYVRYDGFQCSASYIVERYGVYVADCESHGDDYLAVNAMWSCDDNGGFAAHSNYIRPDTPTGEKKMRDFAMINFNHSADTTIWHWLYRDLLGYFEMTSENIKEWKR